VAPSKMSAEPVSPDAVTPDPIAVEAAPKVTGLTKRSLAGTGWSTITAVARQILTIASVMTVARILGPRAYGLVGMSALVTNLILNFRDLGTTAALIQRPAISRSLLSSLFWINVSMGLLLSAVTVLTAPLVAQFFHTPELIPILRVFAISMFIASCGLVHNAILTREMSFRSIALTDLIAAVLTYLVALAGALAGWGVWSLVFASVTTSLASTIGYWIRSSFRPRFEFNFPEVKSIAVFSSNLSASGLVNYAYRNTDNLIVGRVLGSVPLGYYQMAYNLMLTPIQNISSVISAVLFPAFSRIQDDNDRFRSAYVRACLLIALLTFPVMAGLGVVADPLIRAVLGTKWLGAIPIFQVLSTVGLVQSVQTTVGVIYQAKGRTDLMLRLSLLFLIATVVAFLVGVHFGALGVAVAYATVFLGFLTIPGFAVPFRLIDLSLREFGSALLPQLLITALMSAACAGWLLLLKQLSLSNPWLRLASTSTLGVVVYIAALLVVHPPVLDHLADTLGSSENRLVTKTLAIIRRT
jgi:O-antigen/teichoic acid export membrane protein